MSTIYAMSVPIYVKTLGNLSTILDKAAAHAEGRRIDPAVLLAARLYPDMFPLSRQIQLSTDFAKGSVSRLAGREPPKYEDNETTIAQLKDRIARTIEFLRGFAERSFSRSVTRRTPTRGCRTSRTWLCRTSSSMQRPLTTSCATTGSNSASATSSATRRRFAR